jgi:hypothetical protein
VYPSFHVIAGLAPLSGATLLAAESSSPGTVGALALRDGAKTILWLANLTEEPVAVELPAEVAAGARIAMLDASGFEGMTRTPGHLDATARPLPAGPVTLDAYAVARIESG